MATPVEHPLNLVTESLLPTDYSLGKKPQMSLYSIRNISRKRIDLGIQSVQRSISLHDIEMYIFNKILNAK